MKSGLLMVYTSVEGNNSEAAFGQAFRALGRGVKVCIVQFVNRAWKWDVLASSARFGDLLEVNVCPREFSWTPENRDVEAEEAGRTWQIAREKIASEAFQLIVLDDLATVLAHKLLDESQVIDALTARHEDLTVIVTGQEALKSLIEAADLVTEVKDRKAVAS